MPRPTATISIVDNDNGQRVLGFGISNDTYPVTAATDRIIENQNGGTDLVRSPVSYTDPANVENLTLTGVAAINGTGNAGANLLTGNAAANTLSGLAGNDTLNGGPGADLLTSGAGRHLGLLESRWVGHCHRFQQRQ